MQPFTVNLFKPPPPLDASYSLSSPNFEELIESAQDTQIALLAQKALNEQKASLENCPPEILLKILKKVSFIDILNLSRVSRGMYEICQTPELWKHFLNQHQFLIDKKQALKQQFLLGMRRLAVFPLLKKFMPFISVVDIINIPFLADLAHLQKDRDQDQPLYFFDMKAPVMWGWDDRRQRPSIAFKLSIKCFNSGRYSQSSYIYTAVVLSSIASEEMDKWIGIGPYKNILTPTGELTPEDVEYISRLIQRQPCGVRILSNGSLEEGIKEANGQSVVQLFDGHPPISE